MHALGGIYGIQNGVQSSTYFMMYMTISLSSSEHQILNAP